jgi:hypothetical protein
LSEFATAAVQTASGLYKVAEVIAKVAALPEPTG